MRNTEIISRSFEAMEMAQELIDTETRIVPLAMARIMYEIAWCVWQMAISDRRKKHE